jgi:hypothetical protein
MVHHAVSGCCCVGKGWAPSPGDGTDVPRWSGFAFDNGFGVHEEALAECAIDSRVVRWDEYLPFVEGGG